MFYAIEYAYGSHVVNNGNRPDRVYEFTARRLRDAWVAAGPPDVTASGYRSAVTARHPQVRGDIRGRYDGDAEAWQLIAATRVNGSAALAVYRHILVDYDWPETDRMRWVATAPERDVLSWARDTKRAAGF